MIIFGKLITSTEDIPAICQSVKRSYGPTRAKELGDMALARVAQNLADSVLETPTTELKLDPVLADSVSFVRSTFAPVAIAWRLAAISRGFYVKSHPGISKIAPGLNNVTEQEAKALTVQEIYTDGKLPPRRVRLSRKVYARSIAAADENKEFATNKIINQLTDHGVCLPIIMSLVQGDTLLVVPHPDVQNLDFGSAINLCDSNGRAVGCNTVLSSYLEPVYEKVRTDAEAAKFLFQAKTHVNKFIKNPTRYAGGLNVMDRVVSVKLDEENQVLLRTDAGTMIEISEAEGLLKIPRYILRGFNVRIPGNNACARIIDIVLNDPPLKESAGHKFLVHVETMMGRMLFMTPDKLHFPRKPKRQINTEKFWQACLAIWKTPRF